MNAYKSILVYLDNTPRCAVRLRLAIELARMHGAHLIGVSVPDILRAMPHPYYELSEALLNDMYRIADHAADEADARFRELTDGLEFDVELRRFPGITSEIVTMNAPYADLTVVGQAALEPREASTADRLPEEVALASGRPVLVVPDAGQDFTIGKHVLVTWNASREAARAMYDALPILQRAEKVTVLSVNPKKGKVGDGELPAADIALQLARHDVEVEATQIVAKDGDEGDTILSCASDLHADLIVCGAYGHSRMREMVLGGVTRTLLHHMTVPLLISH